MNIGYYAGAPRQTVKTGVFVCSHFSTPLMRARRPCRYFLKV